ncbi:MAG: MerR family transcriptional regulator [Candidatus Abyssobacteria bacterium SURF_5]|uniref:MerR family transcriptional regulator n=1 Tax=Abyssobacteria bacterium (strain SURF_5) TaxID=2093360 RepID=A0A3A4N5E6_ABYX5|nr:MAG: MerR family transcriptional regulator [Candidatus Abyssubacteria bacterium SURF_5]
MRKQPIQPPGLRISQLAALAGVPVPTVKHYLHEGLLPRPIKTGRTMSYYDAACVDKIRLIKRLQSKRFFPLNVIKRIIDNGAIAAGELALGEALLDIPAEPEDVQTVSRKRVAGHTRYSLKKIDRMESLGLLRPVITSRGKEYDASDCRVIALMRQREEAGFPFDYSLEMMSVYRRHIQEIVKEDARLFLKRLLPSSSPASAAQYIREGDKALGAFMPLMKAKLVRAHAEKVIETVNSAPEHLKEILRFRRAQSFSSTDLSFSEIPRENVKRTLIAALGKRRDFPAAPHFRTLGQAVLSAAAGNFRLTLAHLEELKAPPELFPLVAALKGLALYGSVPETRGVFSTIQPILDAVAAFRDSRIRVDPYEVCLISSYIRGAVLSVIPDVFDTHSEAAMDLKAVAEAHEVGEESAWRTIAEELKLKALFHLSQMLISDEALESARHVLTLLKEKAGGTFYGKWASKQLAALAEEGDASDPVTHSRAGPEHKR